MEFEFFHAYLISFLVGFFWAIVSALLSGIFGGEGGLGHHEVDLSGHDFDPGLELDPGMVHFSPLSPTIIATFLTAFGGTGMICLRVFNMSEFGSVPVAILVAVGVATLLFIFLQWVFQKTQASVNIEAARLVGTRAEVITSIPDGGVGEIAFVVRGTRQNAPARAVDGGSIGSPAEVEIVRVVGSSFIVKRPSDDGGPNASTTAAGGSRGG